MPLEAHGLAVAWKIGKRLVTVPKPLPPYYNYVQYCYSWGDWVHHLSPWIFELRYVLKTKNH